MSILSQLFSDPEQEAPAQEPAAPAASMASGALGVLGGMGNAAVAGMLPGLGGGLDLGGLIPSLPDLGGLIPDIPLPSFPTPEIPIPGLPGLPSLPDLGLPQLPTIGMPPINIPGMDAIQGGIDTVSQIWGHEGASALLDPMGALDRQNARQELAGRFQVVGDDFVGPRNHNQVSAEEYERIVRTYSDIRLGRGDLTINTDEMTDPAQESAYRQGTMDQIADMMMTTSGRNMIYQLHNNVQTDDAGNNRRFIGDTDVTGSWYDFLGSENHRHTTIRAMYNDVNGNDNLTDDPHTAADYDNSNAYADAAGAHGENGAIDTSGRSRWSRDAAGNRGRGTDSTIWFNPTAQVGDLAAADSDVVLAHEMQHALHETQGTMATGRYSVPGPDQRARIANFERQAVGLDYQGGNANDPQICPENTYRAERNQLGDNFIIRQNYSGRLPGRTPPPTP